MSNISIVKEGTWLYDGQVPTGVRIVSCDVRYGSGDWEDGAEARDDFAVSGFDVQWASPTSPKHYSDYASAVFLTLEAAIEHAEEAAWVKGRLNWFPQV